MLEPERSRECVSVGGLLTDTCPALPARGALSMRTSCSPLDSHFVDGVGDGDVEGGMMKVMMMLIDSDEGADELEEQLWFVNEADLESVHQRVRGPGT